MDFNWELIFLVMGSLLLGLIVNHNYENQEEWGKKEILLFFIIIAILIIFTSYNFYSLNETLKKL